MSGKEFHHTVHIYYEDTDHSGFVYHANYLKFFERGREHAIGRDVLSNLWHDKGMGFVVYRMDIEFKDKVKFGETVDVRSTFTLENRFRMICHQSVWREGAEKPAVVAEIELLCLNKDEKLISIPPEVLDLA